MEPSSSYSWSPPARMRAEPVPRRRLLVHAALLVVTVATTTAAGAVWDGHDPFAHPRALIDGLPFAVTLLSILLVHEAGHYLMCRRHGVSASLPYFLPAPPMIFPLGTFGAFIRIRSRFPDRRALFDIGAAGPWAGFVVALISTAVGLRLSTVLTEAPVGRVLEFGDSVLTTVLTRLVLHADPSKVALHPVAVAGWFGLFVTSINLLPVGQLDGGHVLYAAAGRRPRLVPALLIASLAWLGMNGWPGWIAWALVLALFFLLGHPPTDDDPAPLGLARRLAVIATFAVFGLTFVAEPFRIVP